MAEAVKVIEVLKKTLGDLIVQNAALMVDLEEASDARDLAQMKLAEYEKQGDA